MKVIITPDFIELDPDGGRVAYYPYYIDQHWNEQAEDRLVVMQKIVEQWAIALATLDDFEAAIVNSQGYREALAHRRERFEISIADVC